MSTFNPALVKEKLPGAIEEMLEAHKKAVAGAEVVCESCKSTNIPQMVSDGNSLVTIISGMYEYVQKFCGNEGDTAEGEGTMWGVHSAACKVLIATGGEM